MSDAKQVSEAEDRQEVLLAEFGNLIRAKLELMLRSQADAEAAQDDTDLEDSFLEKLLDLDCNGPELREFNFLLHNGTGNIRESEKLRHEMVGRVSRDLAPHAAAAWLGAIYGYAKASGGGEFCTAELLDGMIVPFTVDALWETYVESTTLWVEPLPRTSDQLVELFRSVRQDLPAGKPMPDCAKEWLELAGVKVVP